MAGALHITVKICLLRRNTAYSLIWLWSLHNNLSNECCFRSQSDLYMEKYWLEIPTPAGWQQSGAIFPLSRDLISAGWRNLAGPLNRLCRTAIGGGAGHSMNQVKGFLCGPIKCPDFCINLNINLLWSWRCQICPDTVTSFRRKWEFYFQG